MTTTTRIKEVARQAGVSIGTVSNVLNRPDLVTASTRKRILDAIAKLGYVRNDSARQLRAGRSRQIAIVVLDVANPFFTDVVCSAEGAVEDHDVMVVLCNSSESAIRERHHLDLLEEQRVRGVLITPVDDTPDSRLEEFIQRGTPVVLVDRGSGRPNQCSVAVDDILGRRLASAHLRAGPPARRVRRRTFSIQHVANRHTDLVASLDGTASVAVVETPNLTVASGRTAAGQIADLPDAQRHRRTHPQPVTDRPDLSRTVRSDTFSRRVTTSIGRPSASRPSRVRSSLSRASFGSVKFSV